MTVDAECLAHQEPTVAIYNSCQKMKHGFSELIDSSSPKSNNIKGQDHGCWQINVSACS